MLERLCRHFVFVAGLDEVSSDVSCDNDVSVFAFLTAISIARIRNTGFPLANI